MELWHSKCLPKITTLASCPKPDTVARMRSFIGAFKVFSRIIPGCSTLMANLDDTIADCESKQMAQWTDDLLASFHKAQSALIIAHTPHSK